MLAFPVLPGQGWSVHKRPLWRTQLAESVSGREVRRALYRNPRYEFEVKFEGLASDAAHPGLQAHSLQALMAFFHQCQGRLNSFVYSDPVDCYAAGQVIGTGDGATAIFVAPRDVETFREPVGWVQNVAALYANGVALDPATWSLGAPNLVTLATAPASGVVITADFWFGFLCRLDDDILDVEQFMKELHSVGSFKFKSVRSS